MSGSGIGHPTDGHDEASTIEEASHRGSLLINQIVYAEVCTGFLLIEDVDEALPREYCRRAELPWAAAFLVARAFSTC